jgi:hypothetical protein
MVHGELGEVLERSVELGGGRDSCVRDRRDRGRCEPRRVVAGRKLDPKPAS